MLKGLGCNWLSPWCASGPRLPEAPSAIPQAGCGTCISIAIAVFETVLLKTADLLRILARSVSIAQAPSELVPSDTSGDRSAQTAPELLDTRGNSAVMAAPSDDHIAMDIETDTQELTPEELRRLGPRRLLVRVRSIVYQAEGINAYEVVDPTGADLPSFEPGSHIDLYFRDGRVRQYSLCSDPLDRRHYVFAVQREAHGRGGSKAIFERVHVGRILAISEPRNNFPLSQRATRHLLLAGGIGVTPMMAMIHRLRAASQEFVLHYCTRSPERTAFLEELRPLRESGLVFLHHDGGDPTKGLDLGALLRPYDEGTHLYYCGPSAFMNAVREASAHWPIGTAHFEHFNAPPDARNAAAPEAGCASTTAGNASETIGVGFQVKLARSGRTFDVPDDKTIVQVLRENGIVVETSCESGLCGTCRARYLSGVPDHRDFVLDDEAKKDQILICCSRSLSNLLVLDL